MAGATASSLRPGSGLVLLASETVEQGVDLLVGHVVDLREQLLGSKGINRMGMSFTIRVDVPVPIRLGVSVTGVDRIAAIGVAREFGRHNLLHRERSRRRGSRVRLEE